MTKIEFNDLFDLFCYGHDADISIIGQRYFLEWCTNGLIIYPMKKDSGQKITTICGNNKNEIVNKLFDYEFIPGKSINTCYQEFLVLDIE